jgi:glucokinase
VADSTPCFLGLDIGGSSIKAGVVTADGDVLASRQTDLELKHGLSAGLDRLYASAERVVADSGVAWDAIPAIGVAAPGTMDIPAGIVFHPFNLPGWEHLPLARLVAQRFGKPAWLQNDANAAALGEFWIGAARDVASLMMWTLGTGVGGGIVIDGRVWEGAHSHGGECGHLIVQMDGGPRSEHGIHGSLELYVGAKALVRRCLSGLEAGRPSVLRSCIAGGEELTPLAIARAAEQGDLLAEEAILEGARVLGVATVSIMHVLDPAMVLIGGAMTFGRHDTDLGRRFLQVVRDEVRSRAFPIPGERTIIDYAQLGNRAGFIGAAAHARLKAGQATR